MPSMNRALPPSGLKVILLCPPDRRAVGPAPAVTRLTHPFTTFPC